MSSSSNLAPSDVLKKDNLIKITHKYLEDIDLDDIYVHPFADIDNLTSVFRLDEMFDNIYTSYLEFDKTTLHYPYITDEEFYQDLMNNTIRGTDKTIPAILPELNWDFSNMADNLNYILFNKNVQEKLLAYLSKDNILNPKLIDLLEQYITTFNEQKILGRLLLEEVLPIKRYSYGNLLNFKRPEYIKGFFSMKGTKGDLDYLLKFIGYDSNVTYLKEEMHHISNIDDIQYESDITNDEFIEKIMLQNGIEESYNTDNLILNISANLDADNFQGLFAKEIEKLANKLTYSRMSYGSEFREFKFSGNLINNYDYSIDEVPGVLIRKQSFYDYKVEDVVDTEYNSDKKECVDWSQNYFTINNGCSERYVDNTRGWSIDNEAYDKSDYLATNVVTSELNRYNYLSKDKMRVGSKKTMCPDGFFYGDFLPNDLECRYIDNKLEGRYIGDGHYKINDKNLTFMEFEEVNPDYWLTYTFPIENDKDWFITNNLGDARIPYLDIHQSDSFEISSYGYSSTYGYSLADKSMKSYGYDFIDKYKTEVTQDFITVKDRRYTQIDYAFSLYSWELDNSIIDTINNNYEGVITNRKIEERSLSFYGKNVDTYEAEVKEHSYKSYSIPDLQDLSFSNYILNSDSSGFITNYEQPSISNIAMIDENSDIKRGINVRDSHSDGIFKLWYKYISNIEKQYLSNDTDDFISNTIVVPETLDVISSPRELYDKDIELVSIRGLTGIFSDIKANNYFDKIKDKHFYKAHIESYLSRYVFVDNNSEDYVDNSNRELLDNNANLRAINSKFTQVIDKFVEVLQANIDNHLIVGIKRRLLDVSLFDEFLGNDGYIDNTTVRFINNIYNLTIEDINNETIRMGRGFKENAKESILGYKYLNNRDELIIDNLNSVFVDELHSGSKCSILSDYSESNDYVAKVEDNQAENGINRDITESMTMLNNEQIFITSKNTDTDEEVNYVLQDVNEANLVYGGLVINGDNISFKDEDYEIYPYYVGFDYIFYKIKTS